MVKYVVWILSQTLTTYNVLDLGTYIYIYILVYENIKTYLPFLHQVEEKKSQMRIVPCSEHQHGYARFLPLVGQQPISTIFVALQLRVGLPRWSWEIQKLWILHGRGKWSISVGAEIGIGVGEVGVDVEVKVRVERGVGVGEVGVEVQVKYAISTISIKTKCI